MMRRCVEMFLGTRKVAPGRGLKSRSGGRTDMYPAVGGGGGGVGKGPRDPRDLVPSGGL